MGYEGSGCISPLLHLVCGFCLQVFFLLVSLYVGQMQGCFCGRLYPPFRNENVPSLIYGAILSKINFKLKPYIDG